MSFFGGGGGGANQKTYTVTNADLLNAIVIALFDAKIFTVELKSDGAFDGDVVLEAQNDALTFVNACEAAGASDQEFADTTRSTSAGDWNKLLISPAKYPFKLRARVKVKATAGTCKITINYL